MSDPFFMIIYYFGYSLVKSLLKGRYGIEKRRLESMKKKFYYLMIVDSLQLLLETVNCYLLIKIFTSIKQPQQQLNHQPRLPATFYQDL